MTKGRDAVHRLSRPAGAAARSCRHVEDGEMDVVGRSRHHPIGSIRLRHQHRPAQTARLRSRWRRCGGLPRQEGLPCRSRGRDRPRRATPGEHRGRGDHQSACPDCDPRCQGWPTETPHTVGWRAGQRKAVRVEPEDLVGDGDCSQQPETGQRPPGPRLASAQRSLRDHHCQSHAAEGQDGGAVHVRPGVRVDQPEHAIPEAAAWLAGRHLDDE